MPSAAAWTLARPQKYDWTDWTDDRGPAGHYDVNKSARATAKLDPTAAEGNCTYICC